MKNGNDLLKMALKEMGKEKPDLKIAFDLLTKSAERNNSEALYAIGTWYLHGRFLKKNSIEAVKFFFKAIEGNNRSAYYDLAVCYEEGKGVRKNYKAAFQCYLNAALLGDKQAIYEVGRCYYYGIGTAKNVEVSKIWLYHAELHGIK